MRYDRNYLGSSLYTPGFASRFVCELRLGTPGLSIDAAASEVSWLPYAGNRYTLVNSNGRGLRQFSAPWTNLKIAHTADGVNTDVFLTRFLGHPRLVLEPWDTDFSRRLTFTKIDEFDVFVLKDDPAFLYLGTIRRQEAVYYDYPDKRLIWNFFNPVKKYLKRKEYSGSGGWSYGPAVWRAANNDVRNRIEIVNGFIGRASLEIQLDVALRLTDPTVAQSPAVSIGSGIDTTPHSEATTSWSGGWNSSRLQQTVSLRINPGNGYRFYYWLERGAGSGPDCEFIGGPHGMTGFFTC